MIARIRITLAVLFVAIVTLVLLPFQLLFLKLRLPWRNRLPRQWHRLTLWALGVRVTVHGQPSRERPLLVVANHASWLDILALGAIADVTYVAKAEVRDWPVFGLLARLQRSIFIEREQPRKSQAQAGDMAGRLNEGDIVVLFPEGTTSDGNKLLPIKSSLFAAATAAAAHAPSGTVHVQPVAIAYTKVHGMAMGHYNRPLAAWPGDVDLLPHLLGVLKEGALDVEISFGTPIDVTPATNRKILSAQAEGEIYDMLHRMLRRRPH